MPIPGGLVNASSISVDQVEDVSQELNRTVLNQPNLRTVIIAIGSDDVWFGDDLTTVKRELTDLISVTSATGLLNYQRSDGSPVHVILMTVPPLNLDENDQEEQTRRALNTDIRNNYTDYGADEMIDVATILADPANPARTNPLYIEEEFMDPTAAYFDTMAQSVADEVTGFPPGAQL
jgi:hypothetical protein